MEIIIGALLGAALGYGGAWIAPRWMEKSPAPWESYAVAGLNGLAAALLATGHGLDRYFWIHLVFITLLTVASFVDLHDRIIPNEVVLAGLGAGVLLLALFPPAGITFLSGIIGAVAGFFFLFLLAVLVKGGMGFGDVKLAAVIGLFLGWPFVGMGLVLAFFAGGAASALLLISRAVGRKEKVPFGPFLAIGAIVTALYGEQLWAWYMNLQ